MRGPLWNLGVFSVAPGQDAVAPLQAGLWSHSVARHSRVSTTVFPRSLSLRILSVSLWDEFKTWFVQHPGPENPELREPLSAAWVRRLKACVAATGFFSSVREANSTKHMS